MHDDYLLFDGACSFCGDTARTIQDASGGRLQVRALSDPEVIAIVSRGGKELTHRPTLVRVSPTGVRVWTGATMVTRLVSSLGVRNTRRVLQALGEGAAQGPSTPGRGPDRRTFLRGVASGAGLAASAVFLGSSSPASALAGPEVTTPADRAALLSTASRWSGRQEAAKQLRQRGFDREPVDRVALGSATDGVVMAFYGKGEDPDAAAIVTINIVGSDVRGGVEFVTVDLDALFTADGALNVGAMNVTPLQMPGEVSAAGAGSFFACMMLCMGATCASRAFKCKNLIFTSAVLLCIVASCGQQAYTCARRC